MTKDFEFLLHMQRLMFEAEEHLDDLMVLCRADITTKNPKRIDVNTRKYLFDGLTKSLNFTVFMKVNIILMKIKVSSNAKL